MDMDRIIVMWTPGDRQAVAGLANKFIVFDSC